jgi:hypothetical protein
MTACGTFRTSRDVRVESAFGSKADYICSQRGFRLLTHFGHFQSYRYCCTTHFLPTNLSAKDGVSCKREQSSVQSTIHRICRWTSESDRRVANYFRNLFLEKYAPQ